MTTILKYNIKYVSFVKQQNIFLTTNYVVSHQLLNIMTLQWIFVRFTSLDFKDALQ
jgi:hypothetical protein